MKEDEVMENNVFRCIGHDLKIPDIVDSEGVYVIDKNGKKYMDLESGVWCVSIGHKNKSVNQAVMRQLNSVIHSGFTYSSSILESSARKLLGAVGFRGGQCVFLCSGSEAIEITRQISKHLTGNDISMTLHDSYLGSYSSVRNRSTGWYLFDWTSCGSCCSEKGCTKDCALIQNIPGNVSEFVFEPGSSSGFVRFPPASLIRVIAEKVRENGGKIVVNEVTTGTGRTGKWFGFHHYDIVPDMVAVGKGIGNGYPVSAAALSSGMKQELAESGFRYSQSHQNDPLGAAVVETVISYIDEHDLVPESARKGEYLLKRLSALKDDKIMIDVRGRGLLIAVDICDPRTAGEIYDALIERGYIIGNRGSTFRIDPPLTIHQKEIDNFLDAFQAALLSTQT
ncbi:MAG: aminotransferase class III-fold pyridoxal phosphate-dependent enzyme [Spirochaetia bacterium]